MRYRHNRIGKNAGLLSGAAAVVVSAMALPAVVQGQNLLVNPGFESPSSNTNPNNTVTGWTIYGSELRASYENHTPGGEWSMWEQTFQAYGGVYQNVGHISAGTPYTFSGYEYFEANYASTGAIGDLELTWYGPGTIGAGAPLEGTPAELFIEPGSVATGVWTQYSITNAIAPAGTTQVQVSFDFSSTVNTGGGEAGFVDDASLLGAGIAPSVAEWALTGSGDWNLGGNWTTGSIPNAAGAEADFDDATTIGISSPSTVYTNSPITAGILHFNSQYEYEIAGTGNLTLQNTGSTSATVEVDQGTDILDLPITVASNTTLNVASGATLIVANPLTVDSGDKITQTGTGTVTYQSIITLESNAAIAFANSTHAHELSLASGATATVGGTELEVDSLSNLGTVNIENNELLINYGGGADPISSIVQEIVSGYAGGAWTGTGIMSTNAQSNSKSYGIGYADSADAGNPANLASGTIEVLYTLLGDANLDGKVNGIDFNLMATNFNQAVTDGWDKGDFNYDGKVNGIDFNLLAGNFNQLASQTSEADVAALDAFAAANGISLTSVPEPASMGLLMVAGLGILHRRRRA